VLRAWFLDRAPTLSPMRHSTTAFVRSHPAERRRACAPDGSITWVDGTGKFAGASGQIRVMADVQPDGTVVSDYRGELCPPDRSTRWGR
jgi:hypothetical protein